MCQLSYEKSSFFSQTFHWKKETAEMAEIFITLLYKIYNPDLLTFVVQIYSLVFL